MEETKNKIYIPFDLAKELFDRGLLVTNTEYYYKVNSPDGTHEPKWTREVICHAWGTPDIPWRDFIPAPTVTEFDDYIDYSGIVILDDTITEKINAIRYASNE